MGLIFPTFEYVSYTNQAFEFKLIALICMPTYNFKMMYYIN